MSNESEKPVALITGGSARIGAAMIKSLHAAHYRVIIHYHQSKALAEQLQQSCESRVAHSAALLSADLCQYAQLQPLIEAAVAVWGRLDVLINNASRFYPTPLGQANETTWQDLMASNMMSPYFLSQAAYPHLKNTQGCIINISDIKAVRPLPHYDIYCMSKAGLNMLTQSSAIEFAPHVRVNAVAPGVTLWPKEKANALSLEQKEKIKARIPLKQTASVEDITKTVLFLIDNKQVTGQIVAVDGGQSL